MIKKIALIALYSITRISYADCEFIKKDVGNLMDKNKINGISIAIVRGKSIQYCNYGYTDLSKRHKISENTIFEIASITKTFTATLAAIAQLEGKYDLHSPITTYLPALSNKYYQGVTTIELLSYTANIPFSLPKVQTESDLFTSLNSVKYSGTPQSYYSYSNPSIAIVGSALEHVYHQSYQNILQSKLLDKLDMKYTFVNVPQQYQSIVSNGFDKNNKVIQISDLGALIPTGGLKSNAKDLALYLKYQINGSQDAVLNKALNVVHTDYYCVNNNQYQQLAWINFSNKELETTFNDKQTLIKQKITHDCNFKDGFIEKTGTSYGMSSYMAYSSKNKVGIVILLNQGLVSDRVNLARKILKSLENGK